MLHAPLIEQPYVFKRSITHFNLAYDIIFVYSPFLLLATLNSCAWLKNLLPPNKSTLIKPKHLDHEITQIMDTPIVTFMAEIHGHDPLFAVPLPQPGSSPPITTRRPRLKSQG